MVSPDRLRFDFSHTKPMSADEVRAGRAAGQRDRAAELAVETRLMAVDDAMETGAMALFGEKYGEEVRVVSMGLTRLSRERRRRTRRGRHRNKAWSVELCGGTHARRTGDIGLVKIVAESGIAGRRAPPRSADRRRRARLSGEQDERVREVAALLKTKPDDIVERVER